MKPIARMIGEAFAGMASPTAETTGFVATPPHRRRKIWELPVRWHCPLVGTCLPLAELQKLARRTGQYHADMSEYTLHTVMVGQCAKRKESVELMQRFLDERYAIVVARFSTAKDAAGVRALWHEALAAGEVAGALWAAWSHPDLSEDAGKEIYGDIHMLSHQLGGQARADLRRLAALEQGNARLRDEAVALRLGLAEAERQRERTRADLERRLADAEARAALLARREREVAAALQSARDAATLRERAEGLARRVETLEDRNAANARRANALEFALAESHAELVATEAALEAALGACDGAADCDPDCPAQTRLAGRCVLCIGGRPGLVDGYRRLVEAGGGRFLHHDGGQEESLHRLDAIVGGADAVVCQASCISHAAYWRLKEACKKLDKPCIFLKSPGVTSFARGLADLVN